MSVPSELKYTATHEWVRIEDGVASIGITDHAQSELGDVVYVDLPTPGQQVSQEDRFGSVESVKTVSDLIAPLSGEVLEVNPILGGQPEVVNTDPYGAGWLIKIKIASEGEAQDLLSAEAYEAGLD